MRTGITSLADALVSASVVLTAAIICAGAASADPSQQDQFVALLEQDQIPLIDDLPALVARAHQICGELDGGASIETVVNEQMNAVFEENPAYHQISNRVRRTAVRFIAYQRTSTAQAIFAIRLKATSAPTSASLSLVQCQGYVTRRRRGFVVGQERWQKRAIAFPHREVSPPPW